MRTEIASLGEFGLIDRLTEGIKLENESSKYGVGDDAAVLSYPSEKQVLVTTDLLMEVNALYARMYLYMRKSTA